MDTLRFHKLFLKECNPDKRISLATIIQGEQKYEGPVENEYQLMAQGYIRKEPATKDDPLLIVLNPNDSNLDYEVYKRSNLDPEGDDSSKVHIWRKMKTQNN